MVKFILPLEPTAKGRPRFTKQGFAYTPEKTRSAEDMFKTLLVYQIKPKFELLTGALRVMFTFYLTRPASVKRTYPTARPDLDNYIKLASDAMNGIVYKDDSQIIWLEARKSYALKPFIEILIYELGDDGECI